MYASYAYYVEEYCFGEAKVKESEFKALERKASAEVDLRTFNRLQNLDPDKIPDKVRNCICELVEVMAEAEAFKTANASSGASGSLVSYSNDGVSGTFSVDQNSIFTAEGLKKKIGEIILTWLAHTGLLSCKGRWKEW